MLLFPADRDYLAMGNFPYPSSYMTNGAGDLPAYPVRVACEHMTTPPATAPQAGNSGEDGDLWLMAGAQRTGNPPSPSMLIWSCCLMACCHHLTHPSDQGQPPRPAQTQLSLRDRLLRPAPTAAACLSVRLPPGLAQAAGVLYNFSGAVECFAPGIGEAGV